jgi:hypothetical protein
MHDPFISRFVHNTSWGWALLRFIVVFGPPAVFALLLLTVE